jgi:phosphate-selective porin OprO/OprP
LEADGRFSEQWLYRLSLGGLTSGGRFDTSQAFVDDVYATYLGLKTAWTFGQHGEPFSLEEKTSSLAMTFMERALPNALVPGNNVGVSIFRTGKRWSLNAGLFGEDLQSAKDVAEQGFGVSGRFVFRPESPGEKLYHVGGSFSYRLVRGDDPVFYRARPESGLTDVRYVNTGEVFGVDSVTKGGAEAALFKGPLSVQGEYMAAYVQRESPYDNLFFHGWYAYVSWFVTGQSRRYFPREGIFGYPNITSKYGALELAARYSMLDLTDGSVSGGKERNMTLGINWYVSPKARLMANYILVFCDENADDNGAVLADDSPQIFMLRLQVRF